MRLWPNCLKFVAETETPTGTRSHLTQLPSYDVSVTVFPDPYHPTTLKP